MKRIREKYNAITSRSKNKSKSNSRKSSIAVTESFSVMLKKLRAGKKKLVIKTEDNFDQAEKQEKIDPKTRKNRSKISSNQIRKPKTINKTISK